MNQPLFSKLAVLVVVVSLSVIAEPSLSALYNKMKAQYGVQGAETLLRWSELLTQAKTEPQNTQLVMVNDFFNQQIYFQNDQAIWGVSDYWATPVQTMGKRTGDCEDFSIAKYITLLKLGVPSNQLRLVYVKADVGLAKPQAHMVLAYYPTPASEPVILDNLNPEIRPASKRRDLKPVFSFNSEGLWVGNENQPKVKKPETRLSRWRDVLIRMQAEGLDKL